ncbi:hypothetical protein ACFOHS_17130 [Jhaorihella thermophila]
MPQLADHLSRAAPFMQVHLVDLVPDRYLDTIDRYDVDMAMIPGTTFPPWIDHRPLHRSRFVVMDRLGHPKLKTAHVRPRRSDPAGRVLRCAPHPVFLLKASRTGSGTRRWRAWGGSAAS